MARLKSLWPNGDAAHGGGGGARPPVAAPIGRPRGSRTLPAAREAVRSELFLGRYILGRRRARQRQSAARWGL